MKRVSVFMGLSVTIFSMHAMTVAELREQTTEINGIIDPVEKTTRLHKAAEQADSSKILSLLLAKANANQPTSDNYGWTPAMFAAGCWKPAHEKNAALRLLKEHGADLNAAGRDGSTALFLAAESGQKEVYNYLLALGVLPITLVGWRPILFKREEIHFKIAQKYRLKQREMRLGQAIVDRWNDLNPEYIDQLGLQDEERRHLQIMQKVPRNAVLTLTQAEIETVRAIENETQEMMRTQIDGLSEASLLRKYLQICHDELQHDETWLRKTGQASIRANL